MKPDLIFANAPFGKPGIEITKYIMENFPDANYAMLNTRSAFKKYYDKLACQYATIGKYLLGTNENLHWVEQAILLATNGWTEVVENRKKGGENKVGIESASPTYRGFQTGHISHMVGVPAALERAAWNHRERNATLVGVNEPYVYRTGTLAPRRSTHLVGTCISPVTNKGYIAGHITEMCEVQGDMRGKLIDGHRVSHLVQVNKSGPYLGAAMDRHTANVTDTKPTDVKLRNGYIYVSFETFEEACECAIDIISWKNPTDSHYRCVKWGFVTGLVSHERYKEEALKII